MTHEMDAAGAAADVRASTLKVVQYVLRLKLPQASWERVTEIIEVANRAAVAGDLEGLQKAADELLLFSPVRIIKADGAPTESASQKIFERANILIETLQPMRPASTEDRMARDVE